MLMIVYICWNKQLFTNSFTFTALYGDNMLPQVANKLVNTALIS